MSQVRETLPPVAIPWKLSYLHGSSGGALPSVFHSNRVQLFRMHFRTLGDFARYLESIGELHRVSVEVDPYLEITEIATRAVRENKPALLFEKVKNSAFPVLINTLASSRRCELGLQKHPEELGRELLKFAEEIIPPSISGVLQNRRLLRRLLSAPGRILRKAVSQEVFEEADLSKLPVLTCWPEDGGGFLTLPQVVTYDPATGKRNIGIYRMHVYDKRTTGMHWQIQKGGGFHYAKAEQAGKPLEVAVALGTDPAMLLASVAALPENMDEAMFAGFLRGKRTEFINGKTISVPVPANAEFIIEGAVPPQERRMEGPFGDHFGHYSHAAEFPVFYASAITHRKNAVYPATVVGIPPQEDKYLGDATQQILGPLIRTLHSEIVDIWAYYEAGFHNLLVVSINERYGKEAMKTALGLLGTGQLSLSKCIILVSAGVNVRDFGDVLKSIRTNFDPHFDFVMIPKVPLDTLDFTSFTMNLGSKMIIDATTKDGERKMPGGERKGSGDGKTATGRIQRLTGVDRRILDMKLIHDTLLLVKVSSGGQQIMKKMVLHTELPGVKIIAAVSDDIDLNDQENFIWGLFTRFDCERDILFTEQKLIGISPVYKGIMGIDATWKEGYPKPLVMDETVKKKVEKRWENYWK